MLVHCTLFHLGVVDNNNFLLLCYHLRYGLDEEDEEDEDGNNYFFNNVAHAQANADNLSTKPKLVRVPIAIVIVVVL